MTALVYLDTETTGLDPARHAIWEVAWAVGDGEIFSSVVPHSIVNADPSALTLNGYHDRAVRWDSGLRLSLASEASLREALTDATVVGSNPAFDTAFLAARWGVRSWKHRLLDISAYAMPYFGLDEPKGLAWIADMLGLAAPDHSAAGDVRALRECHRALRVLYARDFAPSGAGLGCSTCGHSSLVHGVSSAGLVPCECCDPQVTP